MCFVVEKGKPAKQKASAKQRASTSKKGKRQGKKTTDSDAEGKVIVESEDEWGASPSHRKTNTGNIKADQHEPTTFTIKTCLHPAWTENPTQEPVDTDNEEDQLDVSPSEARKSHGTKRKANHDPPSPTPKSMSRSSSRNMIPEVLIMVPSPPKKIRLTQS